MDDITAKFLFDKLGFDSEDPNLVGTPDRVKRMFSELFVPEEHAKQIIEAIMERVFPTSYDGIVMVSNIGVHSFCPHHLLPVQYEIDIAYIPGLHQALRPLEVERFAIGLSKLVRIADLLSSNLILQETLTDNIADAIVKGLKPKGVAVILKGIHNCMRMRGVKQPNSIALTSTMRGAFRENAATRQEFFELLKHSRR